MASIKERTLNTLDNVHASLIARNYPSPWRPAVKSLQINHARNIRDAQGKEERNNAERLRLGGLMFVVLDISFAHTHSFEKSTEEFSLLSEAFLSKFNQTGNEQWRYNGIFFGRVSLLAKTFSLHLNQIHDIRA